jgi:hypothetical protein
MNLRIEEIEVGQESDFRFTLLEDVECVSEEGEPAFDPSEFEGETLVLSLEGFVSRQVHPV